MEPVTTTQAADRLGVTPEAVRKMLNNGRLTAAGRAGRTLLVDPASLQRVQRGGKHAGRLWAPATAWAALCLLSGEEAPWIGSSEKSRLKNRLRSATPEDIYLLARNRARINRYRAAPSAAAQVLHGLVPTAGSAMQDLSMAARFGLTGGGSSADGYAMPGEAEAFAAAYGMVTDPAGSVIIREAALADPLTGITAPTAAVAVDLMDSLATRERAAGVRVLGELLRG